jgi:imidazolonepropionase-like amidohydrolase
MWRGLGWADDPTFTNDSRLKYMPPEIRNAWEQKQVMPLPLMKAQDYMLGKTAFRKYLTVLGEMHRAGVPIVAGTDTMMPYVFPGFSLHEELRLLVQAGLTPMEALQTATRNAAMFNGTLADLGTIESGKLADLVLLDANPLDDIRHTQTIRAVITAGRYFDRQALDEMLVQVETLASQ